MSKHRDIWTDEEWEALMKAQGRALKSKLGDNNEQRTEVKEEKDT